MKLRSFILVSFAFINSLIWAQNSPVTSVPTIYGASTGIAYIPVLVTGFSNVGAFSLDMEYDPAVLTYVLGTIHPSVSGSFIIGDNVLPDGKHHIVMSWFGSSASLPDGSALIDLSFNYNGGSSALKWIEDGSSCEYADAAYYPMNDLPTACHYTDGFVTSEKCLNLNFILEGLYNPGTHRMGSALGDVSGPCAEGVTDYTQIELRSASDFANIVFSGSDINLSMTGEARVLVPAALNGNYYITVRHRNSIATVSAVPVSFAGPIVNYNFTDQPSKAYGSNMIQLADGKWAFFSGDVNQDGSVDIGDMSPVDNDAAVFASGYIATDVNGDGIVDIADMTLIDNNAATFTRSITP